jgi:3-oxoacyl-[acyl-carrier-protein] synthase III
MSFTITGTGSCLPAFTVQNDDFTKFVDTSDEWITTRTGIRRRHFIKDETLSQIAVEASQKALENAGLAAADMDLILCATLQGEMSHHLLLVWCRQSWGLIVRRLT